MSHCNWLDVCPDDFRNRLLERLDIPPGMRDSASEYVAAFGNDYMDTEDVAAFCRRMELLIKDEGCQQKGVTLDKVRFRRKYAQQWGEYAEAITARYLLEQGLPLREWNWSPSGNTGPGRAGGEIDLITQRGNRIIFVEVKARCGKHGAPFDAIDDKKRRRLCRGADVYLKMQREEYEYQFDVALITGDYYDYKFEYIEDAFLAPLRTGR